MLIDLIRLPYAKNVEMGWMIVRIQCFLQTFSKTTKSVNLIKQSNYRVEKHT